MPALPSANRAKFIASRLLRDYRGTDESWLPPERKLAAELSVSRPLLREAIKSLQVQGYLKPIHGVGIQIIREPLAPIKSLLESEVPAAKDRQRQFADLRLLVEPQVAAWAATNAASDPAATEALRSTHQQMADAASYDEQVDLDIAFHRAIARLARNQVLSLMLSAVADLEHQSRSITLAAVGVNQSLQQHQAILAAIVNADADAARSAMTKHIEAALSNTRAL